MGDVGGINSIVQVHPIFNSKSNFLAMNCTKSSNFSQLVIQALCSIHPLT